MSRMDKKSIYEIVSACRLCGVVAGDRMPINPKILDPDFYDEDIDLVPKIKECLQLEIIENDGMPPLICVGCSIKVEDFHEFRKMCREIDTNTRKRLGLPLQCTPQSAQPQKPANKNVDDTIYVNNSDSDGDGEPLSKTVNVRARPKPKSLKSTNVVHVEVGVQTSPEESVSGRRTRQTSDDFLLHQIQDNLNLLELRPEPTYLSTNERRKLRRKEREQQIEMDRIKERQAEVESNSREAMSSRAKRLRDSTIEVATPPINKKAKVNEAPNPVPAVFEFECTSCCMLARTASQLAQHVKTCSADKKESERTKTDSKLRPEPKATKQEPKPDAKPSKPAPKSRSDPEIVKSGPKSSKPDQGTPKPGPKSSKSAQETPKPGPKSSKSVTETLKPGPKTKSGPEAAKADPKSIKSDPGVSKPGLKSSRPDPEIPKTGPKSKSMPEVSKPGPNSSKSEPKPALRSKGPEKQKSKPKISDSEDEPKDQDQTPEVVSEKIKNNKMLVTLLEDKQKQMTDDKKVTKKCALPKYYSGVQEKSYYCAICDVSYKNLQVLSRHNGMKHAVTTTPYECACNPCELWFPNEGDAFHHHQEHITKSIPYTCNKCYGEFTDITAYERHFGLDQCISTYEVPDVRCDECWGTFPTDKLLEEHRCAGQSARPGGKCSKCDRKYSLLRNQIIHEMKCKGSKKVASEPVVSPLSSKMLPMQVRLVRCDDILKLKDGVYDVSNISHTFGLDRNYNYPYFFSKEVKSKPRDYTGSGKVENDQDFVNWDSDSNETNGSSKTVEELSTLSIKTLFSPKCLGKVPRKIKDSSVFDSILSIKFSDDIRRNIDSIISNLVKESPSDSQNVSETTNVNDVSKTDVNNSDETLNDEVDRFSNENNGKENDSDQGGKKTENKEDSNENLNVKVDSFSNENSDNVKENTSKDQSTLNETLDSISNQEKDSTSNHKDKNSVIERKVDFSEGNSRSEADSNRTSIDESDKTMDTSDNNGTGTVEKNNEDIPPITKIRPDNDEEIINRDPEINNEGGNLSQDTSQEIKKDMEIDQQERVNISNSLGLTENVEQDAAAKCNENEDELSHNQKHESNDAFQNDEKEPENNDTRKDVTDNDNQKNSNENNGSERALIDNDEGSESTSEVPHLKENMETAPKCDTNEANESNENVEAPNEEVVNENSSQNDTKRTGKDVSNGDAPGLNSKRDGATGSDINRPVDDYTDEQLMAEINAQLGETEFIKATSENTNLNDANYQKHEGNSKRYSLLDDMRKKEDLKSLELDNISDDEFNFDI